jgi:hypothetical protein
MEYYIIFKTILLDIDFQPVDRFIFLILSSKYQTVNIHEFTKTSSIL